MQGVFDWSSLDEFERPFMLAGGIDSTNVARAIRTVRPYGIHIMCWGPLWVRIHFL